MRTYLRMNALMTLILMAQTIYPKEASKMDIYAGKWEVPSPRLPGFDPWRWSGRRDMYEAVEIEDVLADINAYYDKRIHFKASFSNFCSPVGWIRSLDAQKRLFGVKSIHPSEIQVSLGALIVVPPNVDGPDEYAVAVECYGMVDSLPMRHTGTHGAGRPAAQVNVAIPGKHLIPPPEPKDRWEQYCHSLLTGELARDADAYLFMAQTHPEREYIQKAVEGYEQRLLTRRLNALDQEKRDFFLLGWLHENYTGDLEKAIQCYRRVHEDYFEVPGYQGVAWYRHGLCLEKMGRANQAKEVYLKFIRTYPYEFWVTDALERLALLGVKKEPLHLDLSPQEVALTRQALQRFNAGDYPAALRLWEQIIQSNKYDPWSRLHAAYAALVGGKTSQVQRYLKETLVTAPPFAELARALFSINLPVSQDKFNEVPIVNRAEECLGVLPGVGGLITQQMCAYLRDRMARFPEDPVPHLLRTYVWRHFLSSRDDEPLNHYPIDGPASMKKAVQLAPQSWVVRLYELQYLYELPFSAIRQDITSHNKRLAEVTEIVLQSNEKDCWGLHAFLTELYKAEGIRDGKKSQSHQRAYQRLMKRYLGK